MKSRTAAAERMQLFLSYAGLRLRLFLREILQLHQRYVVAFLYIFGLILSANEQFALRQNLAHLLSLQTMTSSDLVLTGGILAYAWVVAGVVRWSARGGRVHYLAESLPLTFSWERAIRAMALTIVNLILIILFAFGLQHLIQNQGNWAEALPLGAAYYVTVLGLQLSLLEHNWRLFPVWILAAFLLVWGKGTLMAWPLVALTLIFGMWILRRRESKAHDHPELPIGTWEVRCRAAITRRFPAPLMMQISYALGKPALLIYSALLSLAVNALLGMVLKQDIPVSQKIHVYTVITGILSILLSSFFRNFHLQRMEYQSWLQSLPQPETFWFRGDTRFVFLLYLALTVPVSLVLILQQQLPAALPFFVLPIHGLGFRVLRVMQRSRHTENSLLVVLLMIIWFILIAYLCDHALQRISA